MGWLTFFSFFMGWLTLPIISAKSTLGRWRIVEIEHMLWAKSNCPQYQRIIFLSKTQFTSFTSILFYLTFHYTSAFQYHELINALINSAFCITLLIQFIYQTEIKGNYLN